MNTEYIYKMRAFNRFYTNIIGLLDRHILNSNYSLIEARILFELYDKRTLTASDIIILTRIDKGYLSRILKKFETKKIIDKVNSEKDKRVSSLKLSDKGLKEFEKLNKTSNEQAEAIFKNLSENESFELIKKISEIEVLIKKGLKNE